MLLLGDPGLLDLWLFGDPYAELLDVGETDAFDFRSSDLDLDLADLWLTGDLGLSDLILPCGEPERDPADLCESTLGERAVCGEPLLDL